MAVATPSYAIIDRVTVTLHPWRRWIGLAAALLFLNVSLTFRSLWPTPFVRWQGELSIELAACVLILLAARRWLGPPSPVTLGGLSALWLVLMLGRYADVTAGALYGREVNLYWDLRHMSGVAQMLASPARRWTLVASALAFALVLFVLYKLMRRALGRVGAAMAHATERRVIGILAIAGVIVFVAERLPSPPEDFPPTPRFSTPVTQTYGRQVRLVLHARAAAAGATMLAPSPSMDSDLALVKGADVFLLFIESYGAVSFERPEFATGLAANRARFEAAIHDTNRAVVSAYVESPTFGGSSWLAHISLLAGIDVRDPDTNSLLMTQKRHTLVTTFARHGYRTIALMPGMWQSWPEGAFYGFNDIYDGYRLDYQGPEFGFWAIPDQFAVARMDALEVANASRAPLFVFFPTISSHIPFRPTPPYQPDWQRMLKPHPFDTADLDRAFGVEPDWFNLGPSYVDALAYDDDAIAGYLRERADRDFVVIVIGDHQPAAAVSGEGARWDVPVHIIANPVGRKRLLDRLIADGFRPGLTPARPAIGPMHSLLPVLLHAFGDRESTAAAAAVQPSAALGHLPRPRPLPADARRLGSGHTF